MIHYTLLKFSRDCTVTSSVFFSVCIETVHLVCIANGSNGSHFPGQRNWYYACYSAGSIFTLLIEKLFICMLHCWFHRETVHLICYTSCSIFTWLKINHSSSYTGYSIFTWLQTNCSSNTVGSIFTWHFVRFAVGSIHVCLHIEQITCVALSYFSFNPLLSPIKSSNTFCFYLSRFMITLFAQSMKPTYLQEFHYFLYY